MSLGNDNLAAALMLSIVKEFRGFIAGAGTSNSLLNFVDTKNKEDVTIIDAFSSFLEINNEDDEMLKVKDNYLFDMLDNTTGAFFLHELAGGKAFNLDPLIDISKYFYIAYEPKAALSPISLGPAGYLLPVGAAPKRLNPFDLEPVSVKDMVKPLKANYQKNSSVVDDFKNNPLLVKENPETKQKEPITGNFATPTYEDAEIYINEEEKAPDRFNPSLGAIVLRKPGIGLPARNSEHINIFFNAIPAVEISRCTPFLSVAIIAREEDNRPKNISNVTFMRFIRKKATGGFELDENIGIQSGRPVSFKDMSIFSKNDFAIDAGLDVSLMDIFTAPQTMANSNINEHPTDLDGTIYGKDILEPISPFLTLNDVNIDIAGMGAGLYASKVASMSLTLHDRSRLPDISSLVAANQFGSTKIILEYGWSHPDGGIDSDNIIGQYLNALRDRSVYTVKSSNFNFGDGNTVKIDLSLACYGAQEAKSVSCAAGTQIPLSTFKSSIDKVINGWQKKREDAKKKGEKRAELKEVRHQLRVGQRNSTASNSLMTWPQYKNLLTKFIDVVDADSKIPDAVAEQAFVGALGVALGIITDAEAQFVTAKMLKDRLKKLKEKNDENATQLIYGKLYGLTRRKWSMVNKFHLDPFKNATAHYSEAVTNTPDKFTDAEGSGHTISLGKIYMNFIGHSLAMSGLFDEVQMVFYPLNEHAGAARRHTTASMPIPAHILEKAVVEKLANSANLSVTGMFNLIERIIRDNSLSSYGISKDIRNHKATFEKIEQQKKDLADAASADAITDQAFKDSKTKIADQLEEVRRLQSADIEETLTEIYNTDGGPPVEPKFKRPNLSMFMETLTARQSSKSRERKKSEDASKGEQLYSDSGLNDGIKRTICRVHIYDELASTNPKEALMNSLLEEGSAGKFISNSLKGHEMPVSVEKLDEKLVKYIKDIDAVEMKKYIKRAFPSVTYGSANSTIESIRVNSTVSDSVSQVIQITSYANRNNPSNSGGAVGDYEEVNVVPASIEMTMMGMPFIHRGNQIYLDLGTKTTLDNVYTVKSVRHNISSGQFKTSVTLIYAGQGDSSSLRNKIEKTIKLMAK